MNAVTRCSAELRIIMLLMTISVALKIARYGRSNDRPLTLAW